MLWSALFLSMLDFFTYSGFDVSIASNYSITIIFQVNEKRNHELLCNLREKHLKFIVNKCILNAHWDGILTTCPSISSKAETWKFLQDSKGYDTTSYLLAAARLGTLLELRPTLTSWRWAMVPLCLWLIRYLLATRELLYA